MPEVTLKSIKEIQSEAIDNDDFETAYFLEEIIEQWDNL